MDVLGYFRGYIFALLCLMSTSLGIIFFTGLLLPFQLLNAFWYRRMTDEMLGSWMHFAVSLLEIFGGMKVVLTGDKLKPAEKKLIIMNHRTRLDWMYFWSLMVRQSGVRTEKIILKSPLKHIPGAGWAMQVGGFIFIDRNWEKDKVTLATMLDYYAAIDHNTQVLLFPEGTDLTPYTKKRSDEFAAKNNLPEYNHVLHPRTTGFVYILDRLVQKEHIDAIYDVTVAYPNSFPQNEVQLLSGNFPDEVHFHVKRHDITSLPSGEDAMQQWCNGRWAEKETLLQKFYQRRSFESDDLSHGENCCTKRTSPVPRSLRAAFVYWMLFMVAILVLLYYSWIARYFAVFQVFFYLYMGRFHGGFEVFQARSFLRRHSH